MRRWRSSIASVFPPPPHADGHATVKVASRFGTLELARQVVAPVGDGPHVMAGNTVLPPHQAMLITRGVQELACLWPQDLSFDTVTRLLGWQTHEEQILAATTVRTLVRTHGQIMRQAEQAEVMALLSRDDLATLTPQLAPTRQPRRCATQNLCVLTNLRSGPAAAGGHHHRAGRNAARRCIGMSCRFQPSYQEGCWNCSRNRSGLFTIPDIGRGRTRI